MSTKFLRKIILEEIKNILKEEDISATAKDITTVKDPSIRLKNVVALAAKLAPSQGGRALRLGDTNETISKIVGVPNFVSDVQSALKMIGYKNVTDSGVYDRATFSAVKDVQRKSPGLVVDGKLGQETIQRFLPLYKTAKQDYSKSMADVENLEYELRGMKTPEEKEEEKRLMADIAKAEKELADLDKPASTEPVSTDIKSTSPSTQTKMMPSAQYTPKEGDQLKTDLGIQVWHNNEWIPKVEYDYKMSLKKESLIRKEIAKLLKRL